MNLSKTIVFRISQEHLQDIAQLGKEIGLPTSTFCRMAVIKLLDAIKKEQITK